MPMRLVLIGGAKGVGKTTVVDALRSLRPEWDYAYNGAYIRERLGTAPFHEIKRRMLDDLLSRDVPLLVVDTHYAQHHNGGWRSCWPDQDVERVASTPTIEAVQTYIVSATPEAVYARRAGDPSRRRRIDMRDIIGDMLANDRYRRQMNAVLDAHDLLERTDTVVNDDAVHAAGRLERLVLG